MPKLLLLLSCLLIASGSICQSPPADFPDKPTITWESVGKAKIRMPVSELKALYKGCIFEPRSMVLYGYTRDKKNVKPTALCVKYRGKELFVANIYDGMVWDLIVLADRYKTAEGMYVGATTYMLKNALPGLKVEHTGWDYAFQIVTNSKEETINYWFKNAEDLGNYDVVKGIDDVPLRASTATINWIEVTAPPI